MFSFLFFINLFHFIRVVLVLLVRVIAALPFLTVFDGMNIPDGSLAKISESVLHC